MSKNYTVKQMKEILNLMLSNALSHMYTLEQSALKLGIKNDGTDKPEVIKSYNIYSMNIMLINDIIHPAHNFCHSLFKKHNPMIDHYISNHIHALEKNFIVPCACDVCQTWLSKNGKKEEVRNEYQPSSSVDKGNVSGRNSIKDENGDNPGQVQA